MGSTNGTNFDSAVEMLDEFLRTKTVHSVKSIQHVMTTICNNHVWETVEDQNDFANICSNFEKYCRVNKMTSFGRKQFEAAWENGFYFEDSLDNAVKMLEPLQEDPLPNFGMGEDPFEAEGNKPPEGFTDVKFANIYIEQMEVYIEKLKLENMDMKKRLKEIGKMVNPWD